MNKFLKFTAISGLVLITAVLFSATIAPTPVNADVVTPSSIGLTNSFGSGYNPAWVPNTATSSWVVYATGGCEIQWKTYQYTSTFTLSQKSSVTITGRYAVDDILLNTKVNGNDVGISSPDHAYSNWNSLTITVPASETNVGANSIVFTLQDTACAITGFRVEYISATVAPICTPNASLKCVGNAVYNFDSCGAQGLLAQQCTSNQTCSNAQCVNSCTQNASQRCVGNAVYNFDSCGVQGNLFNQCLSNQTCLNGFCLGITCSSNSQCGTNGLIGSPFCQSGNVYQSYTTWTCNSPGTANSTCASLTTSQLKTTCTGNQTCSNGSCSNQNITCSANTDCGTNAYTGSPFCQGNNVYQNYITYTCNNAGTGTSYCSNNTASQLKNTCTGSQTCTNGSCANQNIACSSNTDCGTNAYTGSPFCQGSNVYQNYITYTCNNSGTSSSFCSNNTNSQLKTTCSGNQTCSNGSCSGNNCTYHSYQQCQGSYLYWYDSCGVQQDSQYCPNGCSGNSCGNNNCNYHSYEQCIGNNLYWYNSCGVQQDLAQYCPNGCSGNSCANYNNNNYSPYGICTYHAYKLCIGNNIYWYDSCGTQQDFLQSCSGNNLVCQYGLCVAASQPIVIPQYNTYVFHYRTGCYNNNLYWYDSLGRTSGLNQNCSDGNSCTSDSCVSGKCLNAIKCDGTTCAVGTPDYNSYCLTNNNNNNSNNNNSNNNNNNSNNNNNNSNNNTGTNTLSISFFAKQDATSSQWQKTVQVGPNGQVYFMISVVNNAAGQVNNVNVSANIPSEIYSLGNLQVNGVPVSGDIVAGINVGSVSQTNTKLITFEGKTQSFSAQATKQATATSNVSGVTQSDSVSINLNPGQVAGASVSSAPVASTSDFWSFLKRWYLWILVALVLVFLFVVVFRRLSSNS